VLNSLAVSLIALLPIAAASRAGITATVASRAEATAIAISRPTLVSGVIFLPLTAVSTTLAPTARTVAPTTRITPAGGIIVLFAIAFRVLVPLPRRLRLLHQSVERALIQPRLLKWLRPPTMRQHQHRSLREVIRLDAGAPLERSQRPRGLIHHQIGTQARNALRTTKLTDQEQQPLGNSNFRQQCLGTHDLLTERRLLTLPATAESLGIRLPRQTPPDNLGSQAWLLRRSHLHHQAEAVE
jgi:hypothetical protein